MSNTPNFRSQIKRVRDQGFAVVPGFLSPERVLILRRAAELQLSERRAPLELEIDLKYPGAPASHAAAGGDTVRRLLDALGREPLFAEAATAPLVRDFMAAYFGEAPLLSRVHHNCLMTKHPHYGSLTGWHRDARYWSFEREDLVSLWIAIGVEHAQNGGLWFVPRSNRAVFGEDHFDAAKFFRHDRADNAQLLAAAQAPRLEPGDAVFFHCNTLHSAGPNLSEAVKFSLVFTYHGASNQAIAGTRSALLADVAL